MIIPENSYFKDPPIFINPELVLVLNAIRCSVEICEISYIRLVKLLSDSTENPKVDEYEFSGIYLEAWSIINNSVIFRNILLEHFEVDKQDSLFAQLNKAKELRNTYQHIDERITEVLAKKELPVFGTLSWFKRYPDSNKAIFCSTYSGSFTLKNLPKVTFSNIKDENLNNHIQKIELSSVIRKPKNKFENSIIYISTIMYDLSELIKILDYNLKEYYKDEDDKKRHRSDLIIKLKGKMV